MSVVEWQIFDPKFISNGMTISFSPTRPEHIARYYYTTLNSNGEAPKKRLCRREIIRVPRLVLESIVAACLTTKREVLRIVRFVQNSRNREQTRDKIVLTDRTLVLRPNAVVFLVFGFFSFLLLFLFLWIYNSVRISAANVTVLQSFRSWVLLFSRFVTSSVSKSFLIHRFLGLPLGLFPVGRHSTAALILVVSAFCIAWPNH